MDRDPCGRVDPVPVAVVVEEIAVALAGKVAGHGVERQFANPAVRLCVGHRPPRILSVVGFARLALGDRHAAARWGTALPKLAT